MESVILVIHLFLALAIIGLVLLQRSEGGGLGIGGSSGGGMGGLASPRGTANFLTKATAFCAAAFFCTSLGLGILAGGHSQGQQGILADVPAAAVGAAAEEQVDTPAAPLPESSNDQVPVAPLAE